MSDSPKYAIIKHIDPTEIFEVRTIVEFEEAFTGDEICSVCGALIGHEECLWTVAEGIAAAVDIFIHNDCIQEYRRTQFSFWFRGN